MSKLPLSTTALVHASNWADEEYETMTGYEDPGPTRDDVDAWSGPALLEFGADWCGHCQGAQPLIGLALGDVPEVRHVKVADGKGKPLGRSFAVKLWPTLVFLKDGKEVARVVRPIDAEEVRRGLAATGVE